MTLQILQHCTLTVIVKWSSGNLFRESEILKQVDLSLSYFTKICPLFDAVKPPGITFFPCLQQMID